MCVITYANKNKGQPCFEYSEFRWTHIVWAMLQDTWPVRWIGNLALNNAISSIVQPVDSLSLVSSLVTGWCSIILYGDGVRFIYISTNELTTLLTFSLCARFSFAIRKSTLSLKSLSSSSAARTPDLKFKKQPLKHLHLILQVPTWTILVWDPWELWHSHSFWTHHHF